MCGLPDHAPLVYASTVGASLQGFVNSLIWLSYPYVLYGIKINWLSW